MLTNLYPYNAPALKPFIEAQGFQVLRLKPADYIFKTYSESPCSPEKKTHLNTPYGQLKQLYKIELPDKIYEDKIPKEDKISWIKDIVKNAKACVIFSKKLLIAALAISILSNITGPRSLSALNLGLLSIITLSVVLNLLGNYAIHKAVEKVNSMAAKCIKPTLVGEIRDDIKLLSNFSVYSGAETNVLLSQKTLIFTDLIDSFLNKYDESPLLPECHKNACESFIENAQDLVKMQENKLVYDSQNLIAVVCQLKNLQETLKEYNRHFNVKTIHHELKQELMKKCC